MECSKCTLMECHPWCPNNNIVPELSQEDIEFNAQYNKEKKEKE